MSTAETVNDTSELEARLEQAEAERDALQEEVEELREKLNVSEGEVEGLNEKVEDLESQIEVLEARVADLTEIHDASEFLLSGWGEYAGTLSEKMRDYERNERRR